MLRAVAQVGFAAAVAGLIVFLATNLVSNMRSQGLPTDFGFLRQAAGFRIAGSSFRSGQTILDALLVGLKNTALVSVVGILLATIIGVVVGVARLSSNWLVARAASFYVEALRNVPVLVIIVFWSTAVILKLPRIEGAINGPFGSILSNRGLWLPWPTGGTQSGVFVLVLLGGVLAATGVALWRTRRFDAHGVPHHRVLWAAATVVIVGAAGYLVLDAPVALSTPALDGRAVMGGTAVSPEYAAVLAGLVVYTASHIAEIVRGAIQAVPKGQTEAASAVALTSFQRMRHVVLPQAFRVAVPPIANQYLNLTKNSSLGIAVAYAELTAISFIVIGNANPAPQVVSLMMLMYLGLSLAISLVTNLANRRLQLP